MRTWRKHSSALAAVIVIVTIAALAFLAYRLDFGEAADDRGEWLAQMFWVVVVVVVVGLVWLAIVVPCVGVIIRIARRSR